MPSWSTSMFTEGVCCMNYHGELAWLIARSSEREIRVGPKEKGQKMFVRTYMLGCLAAANFHMFQVWKCFFCRRVFACYRSRGFSDLDQTSPGPTGLEPQRGPPAHLLVFISSGIHALGCSSSIYLSFGVNTSLLCRDRSVMALFSPKRTVQGRQSIQLGKRDSSNLTSYKSVKAILFVHFSLERKEWISCYDVSCIM